MKISHKLSVGLLSIAMLFGMSMTTAHSKASVKRIPNIRTTAVQRQNTNIVYRQHNISHKSTAIPAKTSTHNNSQRTYNIYRRLTMDNKIASAKQAQGQTHTENIIRLGGLRHHTHKHLFRKNTNWFVDGLNHRNLKARGWVSWHESRNEWRVLSYGHRCIGYFQLDPNYLGYKHGHVNLNKKHQVKVADAYAKSRYGDWVHAKRFWQAHHWY